jgi:hypothetical protein
MQTAGPITRRGASFGSCSISPIVSQSIALRPGRCADPVEPATCRLSNMQQFGNRRLRRAGTTSDRNGARRPGARHRLPAPAAAHGRLARNKPGAVGAARRDAAGAPGAGDPLQFAHPGPEDHDRSPVPALGLRPQKWSTANVIWTIHRPWISGTRLCGDWFVRLTRQFNPAEHTLFRDGTFSGSTQRVGLVNNACVPTK